MRPANALCGYRYAESALLYFLFPRMSNISLKNMPLQIFWRTAPPAIADDYGKSRPQWDFAASRLSIGTASCVYWGCRCWRIVVPFGTDQKRCQIERQEDNSVFSRHSPNVQEIGHPFPRFFKAQHHTFLRFSRKPAGTSDDGRQTSGAFASRRPLRPPKGTSPPDGRYGRPRGLRRPMAATAAQGDSAGGQTTGRKMSRPAEI